MTVEPTRTGILGKLSTVLDLLRSLGPAGKEILDCFPVPDWTDREAVQKWAIEVVEVAQALAKMTPTTLDDGVALAVRRTLEDSAIWDAIYRETIDTEALPAAACDWRNRVITCYGDDAENTAIDPLLIIAIIEHVIALIQWWRNR